MDDLVRFNLFGSSPPFAHVIAQIRRVARFEVTVLIGGETGTGKELAARALHYLSPRAAKPFIPVNCGALADTLIESELFGHERGAFTDAKTASHGLINEADGGTLFLDEVDMLSPKAQASLLRFLQDRTYRRVGGTQLRQSNVRLVAASNTDLDALVESRQFRRDLLYRLKVFSLTMPPLRERGDDVTELALTFLTRLNTSYRQHMPAKRFSASMLMSLKRHSWPGNVRELENFIQREYLMCDDDEISAPLAAGDPREGGLVSPESVCLNAAFKEAKAGVIADFERNYVISAMSRAQGNISLAARLAEQDRSAFSKLVRKYRIAQGEEREKNQVD